MIDMLTELKNIGLSDKEARIYLAMLELGPATVLEIAAKAGVNRPTAYLQIEALKSAGLVGVQSKGKKQLFMAESPRQFEDLLALEEKQTIQRRETLEKTLPHLIVLYNRHNHHDKKTLSRSFEGKEGLAAMHEELLKMEPGEAGDIFDLDAMLALFPDYLEAHRSRRMHRDVKERIIYTSTRGPVLKELDEEGLHQSRFISNERMPFSSAIYIRNDCVAIVSLSGTIDGSLIADRNVAHSFSSLFEVVWNTV